MYKVTESGETVMTGSWRKCWNYMLDHYGNKAIAYLADNKIMITKNV